VREANARTPVHHTSAGSRPNVRTASVCPGERLPVRKQVRPAIVGDPDNVPGAGRHRIELEAAREPPLREIPVVAISGECQMSDCRTSKSMVHLERDLCLIGRPIGVELVAPATCGEAAQVATVVGVDERDAAIEGTRRFSGPEKCDRDRWRRRVTTEDPCRSTLAPASACAAACPTRPRS
jgi:hypothetical protein